MSNTHPIDRLLPGHTLIVTDGEERIEVRQVSREGSEGSDLAFRIFSLGDPEEAKAWHVLTSYEDDVSVTKGLYEAVRMAVIRGWQLSLVPDDGVPDFSYAIAE